MRKIICVLALLAAAIVSCTPAAAPAPTWSVPTALSPTTAEKGQRVSELSQNPAALPPPAPTDPPACPPCAETKAAAKPGMWPEAEGLGVMGDSFYDEYQGSDQRGGDYHETTFNLLEILAQTRDLNLGPWGSRGEPRRTGYAYNWARSGATSDSMIAEGQHTGLAEQIRRGEVSYVWIGIGANDFSPRYLDSYKTIYDGTMTDDQLQAKINRAVSNVTLAVDTVLDAGAKGVVVTYFTQWELDPQLGAMYPDAARRKRVADAIAATNQGIQAMADERGIYAFDQNRIGEKLLTDIVDNRYLLIGSQRIDFAENGDAPGYSRLADTSHLSTVMSGMSANWYIINTFNEQFGMQITPLADDEILRIAGFEGY